MRMFHRHTTLGLILGVLLLAGTSPALAQMYTLTIRDGLVYVNGKQLPPDAVPASLDTRSMNVHLSFSGTPAPTFELGGRYYQIEGERLREVERVDEMNDETTVVFRNAAPENRAAHPAYSAAPPAGETGDANALMQQYVFELSENARQLNEMSRTLRERQAQELIQQVYAQAEQAARIARDLPYLEMQQYMADVGQRDQELYQRMITELELEQQTRELARQIRSMPPGDAREVKIAELREMLGHILDLKQENRQREIDQLEDQLALLKKRLADREAMKDRMVERRLQELLGNPR